MPKSQRNQRTYSPPPYRGKTRTRRRIPRSVPIVLICLLALAVIFYGIALHLQQYMVYTKDGGTMVLPGQSTASSSSAPIRNEPISGLDVVEEIATPTISRDNPSHLRAVPISVDDLIAGKAAELLESQDGNALVIEMKGTDGVLLWNTAQRYPGDEASADPGQDPQAGDTQPEGTIPPVSVSEQADAVEAAIESCKSQGIYLIAQIHCLRDDALSRGTIWEYDLKIPGVDDENQPITITFHDSQHLHWLDPTIPKLQDYYSNLAKELCALGFDELLLSSLSYSEEWDNTQISRSAGLAGFLSAITDAVASVDETVRVDVETTAQVVLQGENAASGQTFSVLSAGSDRLWCGGISDSDGLPYSEEGLSSGALVVELDAFQHEFFSPAQSLSTN